MPEPRSGLCKLLPVPGGVRAYVFPPSTLVCLGFCFDFAGNSFPDLILASVQVEEYATVLRNEGGRGLSPAWSPFVEKDFPEDHRDLQAQPTSVADVNGDGRLELVLGLEVPVARAGHHAGPVGGRCERTPSLGRRPRRGHSAGLPSRARPAGSRGDGTPLPSGAEARCAP